MASIVDDQTMEQIRPEFERIALSTFSYPCSGSIIYDPLAFRSTLVVSNSHIEYIPPLFQSEDFYRYSDQIQELITKLKAEDEVQEIVSSYKPPVRYLIIDEKE